MEGRGRMESGGKMRALLLRKGKKEVDRREGRGGKGRGRDLPDQCQTASYAPVQSCVICAGGKDAASARSSLPAHCAVAVGQLHVPCAGAERRRRQ